jgi:hypothetical protein
MTSDPRLPLRAALRRAQHFPIDDPTIRECLDLKKAADASFDRARREGLDTIPQNDRAGLARVTGEVAEAVAEKLLDELDFNLFWQITEPGIHGVDLLYLAPGDQVLAVEVKGTLRPGTIPGLTPSRLRQMSRDWLNQAGNPGMADWLLTAADLYAGVMIVDLARAQFRTALSADFDQYVSVAELSQLSSLSWIDLSS